MAEKKEKRYVSDNAQLMAEWDWEKNNAIELKPEEVSFGSIKHVHWKCKLGHRWQAIPNNRSKGQGCPVCAGRKIEIGFNDFASRYPLIALDWHPEKNEGLEPTNVTAGSHKKIWWYCGECGNEWKTSVANRVAGKGCPICGRRKQGLTKEQKLIEKKGTFASKHSNLLNEWDYEKNRIDPERITKDSTHRVWWRCTECGHSWITTVYHRTIRGSGCPACVNKVTTSQNCIETTHPFILEKWNYNRNQLVTPKDVTAGSNKKVWWVCEKKHEWKASVTSIVNGGICPVCCGQRVEVGYNDLASVNPELATEWHPSKNKELLPTQFTTGSSRVKVWWLCQKGHEYQATIVSRTNGTGCPICEKERKTSFPEQAIFYYLGKITHAQNRYLFNGKTEIDVYLPEYKIGIEYDGLYYHATTESYMKEKKKDALLLCNGITVIRVKEVKDLSNYQDDEKVIYCRNVGNYIYLKDVIQKIIERIPLLAKNYNKLDIDIDRDAAAIMSQYIQSEKENSLAIKSPEIALEWHPTLNGYVTPQMISYASGRKVWWLGKCGHTWQMSVDSRNRGFGCPFCSGKRILAGFNDLQTTHPVLMQEWDYKKNVSITPDAISYGSNKKVWWICNEGHSYQATPSNRAFGKACPICGKEKRARSRHLNYIANNDCVDITHPHLCDEWNVKLNGDILPSMVTRGSNFKAWWNCEKGHNYQSTVANRVAGKGCPICSGKKIVSGINDLVTLNSKLASEWDYDMNILDPQNISPNSHKKAYWVCHKCGNKWESQIKSRNAGSGCPRCARQKNKTINNYI